MPAARGETRSVPQCPDVDVLVGRQLEAHGVEPGVAADLDVEIIPAVEVIPVALAAPAVVAMAEAVDGVGHAAVGSGTASVV